VKKPKENWEGAERRKHPRLDVQIEISYQHLNDFFYDYAINLSRGGMFIRTAHPIDAGTDLKIKFSIPGQKETISTSGKVVRVVKSDDPHGPAPGMGIEFKTLAPRDLELINLIWDQQIKQSEKTP